MNYFLCLVDTDIYKNTIYFFQKKKITGQTLKIFYYLRMVIIFYEFNFNTLSMLKNFIQTFNYVLSHQQIFDSTIYYFKNLINKNM